MFIPGWILVVGVGVIAYFLWRNRLPQKPQFNPGEIPISPEVDSKEFSSLLAETLLDGEARTIFPLLFQSGNGYITWREIMFMKFLLGKTGGKWGLSPFSPFSPLTLAV